MSATQVIGKKRTAEDTETASSPGTFTKADDKELEKRRVVEGSTTSSDGEKPKPAASIFSLGTSTFTAPAGGFGGGGFGSGGFGGGGFAKFGTGSAGSTFSSFGKPSDAASSGSGGCSGGSSGGGFGGFGGMKPQAPTEKVDEHAGLDETYSVGHILLDWYHCDLRLKKDDTEDFFIIQVIQDKDEKEFFTFKRWGKAGEKGEFKLEGPEQKLDDAKKSFCDLFEEKTGNPWAQRHMHDQKPGKFAWSKPALNKLDASIEYKATEAEAAKKAKAEFQGTQAANGEENETVLMEAQCKLYVLDSVKKEYKDKGRGTLRLLVPSGGLSDGAFARLVMRRVKTFDVTLNQPLRAHCTVDKQGKKSMAFGTITENGPEVTAIRFDEAQEADSMFELVQKNIPAKVAAQPADTAATGEDTDKQAEEEL